MQENRKIRKKNRRDARLTWNSILLLSVELMFECSSSGKKNNNKKKKNMALCAIGGEWCICVP